MSACLCVCARACVCVCVRAHMCALARDNTGRMQPNLTHPCGARAGARIVLRPRGGGDATPVAFSRPWERSDAAAAEFASFTWPLTTVAEVKRLLATSHMRFWLRRCTVLLSGLTMEWMRGPPYWSCLSPWKDVLHSVLYVCVCHRDCSYQLVIAVVM